MVLALVIVVVLVEVVGELMIARWSVVGGWWSVVGGWRLVVGGGGDPPN